MKHISHSMQAFDLSGFVYHSFYLNIFDMHIITRKRLNEFADKYPDTNNALANWYRQMKQNNFDSIAEIREVFPSTDKVGN